MFIVPTKQTTSQAPEERHECRCSPERLPNVLASEYMPLLRSWMELASGEAINMTLLPELSAWVSLRIMD